MEMFNLIPVSTTDIGIALGFYLFLVLLGLLLFKCIWLRKCDFYFPAEGYEDPETHDINGLGEVKLNGIRKYFIALFKRIIWFKPKYWVKYMGFEGSLA